METERIAVIGAGPIGVETALLGRSLGHDVHVYERGHVADNLFRWGHVVMFSPASMNRSELGARVLAEAGHELPHPDSFQTGAEYARQYLVPLTGTPLLAGRVHERSRVAGVGRDRIGKTDPLGAPRRRHPFRLLIDGPDGERVERADVVIDASGTYGNPNWMGNGNLPAIGERVLRERIAYNLEDYEGAARSGYVGKRVLLVGGGLSAATALAALVRLDGTRVVWVTRGDRRRPLVEIEDDPLPGRKELARRANDLAGGAEPSVRFHAATTVEEVRERDGGFEVVLRAGDGSRSVGVDRIVALVGYTPDRSIYRELQVHECYASFAPMKLAAERLAGATRDCLAQTSAGPETLRNPEPGFFILGAKSFGRSSDFLIRVGIEQARELFSLIGPQGDAGA